MCPLGNSVFRSKPASAQKSVVKNCVWKMAALKAASRLALKDSTTAGMSWLPVRYNRQLHPEEKSLAKQIADKSGGMYTQAQVEDQMRIMGVSVGAQHESGAPDTLIGQAPTDSGARWISAGTTADGQPILTQITAQANPELQVYIRANYNSASTGGVPSQYTYDVPTGGGSSNVTGPFTKFDKSDSDFVRNTTADTASMVSTNSGRVSAFATTAVALPTPYAPIYDAIAFGATISGMAADAVAQLVKPNVGQYVQNGTTILASNAATIKWPLASYAINETSNTFNNSAWGNAIQSSINSAWNRFVNPPEKK
jgi:filamentous hemagglutinin